MDAKSNGNGELLSQGLALLDTACQAGAELLEYYLKGDTAAARRLLEGLRTVVDAAVQSGLAARFPRAYLSEQLENTGCTLDAIETALRKGDADGAAVKIEFQLFPFLRLLREALYFWGVVCPDSDARKRYYQEEFARNYQNMYVGEAAPACRLSIVVCGYNHLDITRRCVEQLLRETDLEKLHAELILIDHGSTDGTLEYFESLGVGKVIHFEKNVRMYMFAALFQICRGEYFAFVSNDVLVTRHWAEILLNCLESDPQIIMAVPQTPNTSNLQPPNGGPEDPEEFLAWAARRNKRDSARWSDRARLMPTIAMYRTEAVNKIGFADPYFYSMEYWDDDFSLRARRAGYRQVLCGDVACYHYGSVTGAAAQEQEGTLVYGGALFREKHGVDAWSCGSTYDVQAIFLLRQSVPPGSCLSALAVDCGMGDTPLQLRNELRYMGRDCTLRQITCQREYLPDLAPLSDGALWVSALAGGLADAFPGETFDCAVLGRGLEEYEDPARVLELFAERLRPEGILVLFCGNPFFALTFHSLLHFSFPQNADRIAMLNPNRVIQTAQALFSLVRISPAELDIDGLDAFAQAYFPEAAQQEEVRRQLKTEKYYLICKK